MPPSPFLPDPQTVLSVSSFNRLVRDTLEAAFPLSWIGGEISNLTYAASGHVYFSLKDASAQVRCVMWRSRAQLLGWRLENGQKIEARALVSFYEARGEFQLNVEAIRRAGQGDLFERFMRLKAQLENEGLFAVDRKRALPDYPRHLAIVTSPQAAALRDVLSALHRRAPHLRLTLVPTPVQGEGAGQRIAAALASTATLDCDAIILCRGGGSIEDLWAFNEECVARAIRATHVPVISGVGHETDFTIADFAADLRAPTPTAAAELASPDADSLRLRLDHLSARLHRHLERQQANRQQQLDWLSSRLLHPAERLQQRRKELAQLARSLRQAGQQGLMQAAQQHKHLGQRLQASCPQTRHAAEQLDHLAYRLENGLNRQITQNRGKLNTLNAGLIQLNPHAVLARGYAIAFDEAGRAIRQAGELSAGQALSLKFASGSAEVSVQKIVEVVAASEAD